MAPSLWDTHVSTLCEGLDGCIVQAGERWVRKVEQRLWFCCWTSLLGLAPVLTAKSQGRDCAVVAFCWGKCHLAHPNEPEKSNRNIKGEVGSARGNEN